MSNTLLPCPFCGGEAFISTVEHPPENRPNGYRFHGQIVCRKCQATAGTTGFDLTHEEATKKAIAAWNRRADARQLALKTRVCPMCEDCPDGCPVETPKDSRNIVTNADRIRSMTDEELAQFLGDEPPYFATYKQYIDWLRKPIESEVEHDGQT